MMIEQPRQQKITLKVLLFAGAALAGFVVVSKARAANDPLKAALSLKEYLEQEGSFGTKDNPSTLVASVQKILLVADDGIVGPQTRSACKKFGVDLPWRTAPAVTAKVTVTPDVASVSKEPAVSEVTKVPLSNKGSVVFNSFVDLPFPMSMAGEDTIRSEVTKNASSIGSMLKGCQNSPQLVGSPSVIVKKETLTNIKIRWAAVWPTSSIDQLFVQCVKAKAKTIPQVGSYITSLSVSRS